MHYSRVLDGKYEGCIARFHGGSSEVFYKGAWKHFWILERGLEDGYSTERIPAEEAEHEVGKKFHDGEKELIEREDHAWEGFSGKSTDEIIAKYRNKHE